MSSRPISRSPDLQNLRNEGYDIAVVSGFLVVRDVPYVNSRREVARGILVCQLDLTDDRADPPRKHTAFFAGEQPCDKDGKLLPGLVNQSKEQKLADSLTVQHQFSSKRHVGGKPVNYVDFYEKVTTYVAILAGPAQAIDPKADPRTFPFIASDDDDSPFLYEDTASSRAQIVAVNDKLKLSKVAIVGLGGSGSYILDLVSKTPVKEIHLFDGDRYSQHNAFRSPGAPSGETLQTKPQKVQYFADLYAAMRKGILPHDCYLDASNAQLLEGMEFVFICMDQGSAKRAVVEKLVELGVPFIDVGMGLVLVDDALTGILRVTTCTKDKNNHIATRMPFGDPQPDDEYATNIQVADCNALNAALAVIRWKKLFGFYVDLEHEHFAAYTIDGNHMANDERHPCETPA